MSQAWIYSERSQSLQIISNTVGQAQQVFPGPGPVYVQKLTLIAGLENDGIILIGSANVGPLGGAGGTGYVDQLSPGDQRIYRAQDNDLFRSFTNRQEGLISVPEVMDASTIFALLDSSNPFFGAGLNCFLSIVIGDRILGNIG